MAAEQDEDEKLSEVPATKELGESSARGPRLQVEEDEKIEAFCPTNHIDNTPNHNESCTEPERNDLSKTTQATQLIS